MLTCTVGAHRFSVLTIVAVLLALLQPLTAEEQPFSGPLDRLIQGESLERDITMIDAASSSGGHAWYPDLFIGSEGPINTLLVLAAEDLTDRTVEIIPRIPDDVRVAVVSPRRKPTAAVEVVESLPGVTPDTAVLYLIYGDSPEWRLAVEGFVTPLWLSRAIIESETLPFTTALVNTARLGLGRAEPILAEALARGQNAVGLRLSDVSELPDVLASVSAEINDAVYREDRLEERNYLIAPFTFGTGHPIILTESVLIWSIVSVSLFMMLLAMLRPRRVRRYVAAIRHNLPIFIGYFAILLVSLIGGNIAIRFLSSFYPLLDIARPLAITKFAFGLIVLTLFYPLLHHQFVRSSAVYSGAAILLLMAGSLIASIFSLILGAFFVLVFLFGFLFSLSHNALFKSISLLLALIPGTYLLLVMTEVADVQVVTTLLTPPFWREVVMAILLLPLMLMFFRLDILVRKVPIIPIVGMVAVVAMAIAVAVIIHTFNVQDSAAVAIIETYPPEGHTLVESVPENGEVTVAGTLEGRSIELVRDGSILLRCEDPPCSTEVSAGSPPITFSIQTRKSLDRHSVTYAIAYGIPAATLDIVVRSDAPIQLYASDLPGNVVPGDTGTEFMFTPGTFPPSQVSGTLVFRDVPEGTRIVAALRSRMEGTTVSLREEPENEVTIISQAQVWTLQDEVILP